ncbi:hypothetical protein [Anoxybacillus sp. MB8]|uniref:hypothetical protein n=1 Tax=Anoxybacillus sp. MB8 TaxID=2496850 RepID=UPI0013D40DC9|nr:hypothetical protein [Anoxybacillus sp. MB8]
MNKKGKWLIFLLVVLATSLFYYVNHQEGQKEAGVKEEVRVKQEGNDVVAEVIVDEKKSDKEVMAMMQSQAKKLAEEYKGKTIYLSAIRNGEKVANMTVGDKNVQANEQKPTNEQTTKPKDQKPNQQVGGKMNITEAKKVEFLAGTYAYKITGKLPEESKATAVVVKIGSQTFEQAVGENGEFEVAKIVNEEVTEAIVETKGGDEVISQKVTF